MIKKYETKLIVLKKYESKLIMLKKCGFYLKNSFQHDFMPKNMRSIYFLLKILPFETTPKCKQFMHTNSKQNYFQN